MNHKKFNDLFYTIFIIVLISLIIYQCAVILINEFMHSIIFNIFSLFAIMWLKVMKNKVAELNIFWIMLIMCVGPTLFGISAMSVVEVTKIEIPINWYLSFYVGLTIFFNFVLLFDNSENEGFLKRTKIAFTYLIATFTIAYTFFGDTYLVGLDALFFGLFASFLYGIGFIEYRLYKLEI